MRIRNSFKSNALVIWTIRAVSAFAVLLPVILALLYVHRFGVNVVYHDQWGQLPLFGELFSGNLGFSDLFAQHGDHRIFFPRIVMLLLGVATAYNTVAEMYFMQACAIVTLIVFWLAFRDGNRYRLLLFVPIAFLLFSLRQYFSMLQGIQIVVTITQTAAVLAFYCLYLSQQDRFRKVAFPAAVASATIASFSFLQGLFVWPAGLIQLIITPMQRSTKRVLIGVWTLIGVAEWFLYFFSYTSAGDRSKTYFLLHPVEAAKYVFTLAGGSLLWRADIALIAGVVILGLAAAALIIVYRRRELGDYVFWIAVLCFALGFIFAAMVGRVELGGFQQAIASRYVNFTILLPISVYAIIAKLTLKRTSMVVVGMLAGISLLILLSLPRSYEKGIDEGTAIRESRQLDAMALATYEDRAQPDTLLAMLLEPWRPANKGQYTLAQITSRVNIRAKLLEQRAQLLDRLDYNVFAQPSLYQNPLLSELSSIDSTTLSNIDRVDGKLANENVFIAKKKVVVEITGWAVDQQAKKTAGGVYAEVDGNMYPALYGQPEERVAERFDTPAYTQSGFTARIPVLQLKPGTHDISLIILSHDEEAYYKVPQAATITVKKR